MIIFGLDLMHPGSWTLEQKIIVAVVLFLILVILLYHFEMIKI